MSRSVMQHAREVVGDGAGVTIKAGDSPSIDAFARLRVSNPVGIFDSQMQYDTNDLYWYTSPSTGTFANHLPNESSVNLTVAAGQTVIRQTKQYHRYQPGKSQQILMTFVPQQPVLGLYQNVGYFDAQNGIFLRISENDNSINFVLRSYTSGGAVDTTIAQSAWNLDTFDGSGGTSNPSGITLDITKSQILIIDLEWLGVGRVRAGFVVDGIPFYCHEFLNANVNNSVYMTTANLPMRYEISASGGMTGTYSLKQVCSAISSEGGVELERGLPITVDNRATGTVSVSAETAILAIRPKATFNGLVNRGRIDVEGYNALVTTNSAWLDVVYNPTFSSEPEWISANDDSIIEYSVTPVTITGGIKNLGEPIAAAGTNANNRTGSNESPLTSKLPVTLDIDGANPISVALVATPLTGSSGIVASLRCREIK